MSLKSWLLRRRGLGWQPNPEDSRDLGIDRLGIYSSERVPNTVSLRQYLTRVLDQGSTQSCVAHAMAHAIDLLETRAGLKYVPASRRFIYFNARRMSGTPVSDTGTYIRTACQGLRAFGAPDEDVYPWSTNPARINRRPGWNPYMMGHARRQGGYYRIFETDAARLLALQTTLAAGLPVAFGTKITSDFLKNHGSAIIDRPANLGDLIGGHAMLAIGYRRDSSAGLVFEVANSWGTDWRSGGFAWLTAEYMTWTWTQDLTTVEGWDRLKKAEVVE